MKNFKLNVLSLVVASVAMSLSVSASAATKQSDVQAKMVYRFAKMTEFKEISEALNICTVGGRDISGSFDKIEAVTTGAISYTHKEVGDSLDDCSVVYNVGGNEKQHSEVASAVKGKNALLISDNLDDWKNYGYMINLKREGLRIKYVIDESAFTSEGLKPSEKLVRLSQKQH